METAGRLEWGKQLEIGIRIIDEQHKMIVDYINELVGTSGTGDQQAVIEVTDKVLEYTVSHFEFEEMLQEEAGYFARESHKMTHGIFTRQAQVYQRRAKKGEDISLPLSHMLKAWLVAHIQNEDREYVPTVKKFIKDGQFAGALDEGSGGFVERTLKKVFG